MDRAFEGTRTGSRVGALPSLNLYEDGDTLVVTAELPGVAPEDLEIEATLNTLTIKGERKALADPEGTIVHRRERTTGSFVRKVSLPMEVDPDRVKASFHLGVLEIALPRAEASKPRRIAIEA